MFGKLKRLAAGLRNAARRQAYRRFAERREIDGSSVLLDQQHGLSLDGNLHYIARELADRERYGELKLYFTVERRNRKRFEALLGMRGLRVSPVTRSTRRYYRALATSKYLVTDTSFPLAFAKRDGQVLWNTWHGTPLKTLGRSEGHEAHLIGNVQKNFAQADYLSFPNGYTADRIVGDYMLSGLCRATGLLAEYPRNEPFAAPPTPERRNSAIPAGVRAYAYLPTFRFSAAANSKAAAIEEISSHLAAIDRRLEGHEKLYVKLHPAIGKTVPLDAFAHIEPVPENMELYEFLNLCDVLVTDYSSVMFDFAITRKKVVLFVFDRERYLADRGLYRPLDSLPFPQVTDVAALVDELRDAKGYDDAALLAELCPYPAEHAAERLCRRVFNGEAGLVEERAAEKPPVDPVLVLTDRLPADEEADSFNEQLVALGGGARVCLAFPCSAGAGRVDLLARLSPSIGFLPYAGRMALSPFEAMAHIARSANIIGDRAYGRALAGALDFEARRLFGAARFSKVECLTGSWRLAHLARHVNRSG